MKFYSDMTKKLYDTEEALVEAEKELAAQKVHEEEEARKAKEVEEAKKNERKAREEEIEVAYNAMIDVKKKYNELLTAYVRDYGTYRYSSEKNLQNVPTLFGSLLDILRNV